MYSCNEGGGGGGGVCNNLPVRRVRCTHCILYPLQKAVSGHLNGSAPLDNPRGKSGSYPPLLKKTPGKSERTFFAAYPLPWAGALLPPLGLLPPYRAPPGQGHLSRAHLTYRLGYPEDLIFAKR